MIAWDFNLLQFLQEPQRNGVEFSVGRGHRCLRCRCLWFNEVANDANGFCFEGNWRDRARLQWKVPTLAGQWHCSLSDPQGREVCVMQFHIKVIPHLPITVSFLAGETFSYASLVVVEDCAGCSPCWGTRDDRECKPVPLCCPCPPLGISLAISQGSCTCLRRSGGLCQGSAS